MKICMITRYYAEESSGGHQAYVRNVSYYLMQRGHEVIVISQKESGRPLLEFDNTLRVIHVPILNVFLMRSPSIIYFLARKLKQIYKDFDLFVTHDLHAVMAVQLANLKPHVYTHHGFTYEHVTHRLTKPIFHLIETSLPRFLNANVIITVDENSRKTFEQYGKPAITIPVCVDTEKFNPKISGEEIRKRYKLNNNLVILSPKMFYEITGIEYIVKAMVEVTKEFPQVKLLLAGEGYLEPELRSLAHKLKVDKHIVFAGKQPPSIMPKIYAASDVVVTHALAGVQRTSILEAMASGKPVIGTSNPPLPETVTDGVDGFLVGPRNIKQLFEKIKMLLRDEKLRMKIGQNARKKVEEDFSCRKIGEKVLSTYRQVVMSG